MAMIALACFAVIVTADCRVPPAASGGARRRIPAQRVADLWKAIDEYESEEFVAQLDLLVAELPPGSAISTAQDSTGHPDLAVPLYHAALETGLTGIGRRRATIQMASSLRNLGQSGWSRWASCFALQENAILSSAAREAG